VVDFLIALGGEVTTTTSNWATCRCVFARFFHEGKVDNHPSSGMTITGGESRYNCFSCGEWGTPYAIYKKLKYLYGGGCTTEIRFQKGNADY